MQEYIFSNKNKDIILALGAESAGNFSVYANGKIYFSENFGDLQIEANFKKYLRELNKFLKKHAITPSVILSDLHPLLQTTGLAKKLAKKYDAKHIPIQHHIAHIFSAIGDEIICYSKKLKSYILRSCLGIACDGTGFGFDEKIWGGEVFSYQLLASSFQAKRVGHLENQILLGGELAIKEPARMIISIISKIQDTRYKIQTNHISQFPNSKIQKDFVYSFVKKYYSRNEFGLLWNQLQQNFNCLETSSTARILDAVSVLLGFSKNESLEKHGPVKLLEENSTKPYTNLKPKIEHLDTNHESRVILNTTYLFEYLIKNSHKDKKRLAATAQKYIADGLIQIIRDTKYEIRNTYFAGGMANNKIISEILESQGIYINKKIPRGDAGISFGQIIFFLTNSRN